MDISRLAVNTIKFLAIDAIEKANSGHPGLPMGASDYAFILWSKFLKFNPQVPCWVNRDRFILSAGHGSMLLYALLHLSGFNVTLEDLKNFRQARSCTPGHPEYKCIEGVETTTGPLGQGFSNGVGMAIASKIMAARFNTENYKIIDHYIYGIVSDGDMMEGIASESASLAGHLGLGNLIYFYDDNGITIEGPTSITFTEDVAKRFESYNWHVIKIDGHNHSEIERAIIEAQNEKNKPSLIIAKTHIGKDSPNKQDTPEVHGSPLGKEEILLVKQKLNWPLTEFYVPEEVKELFNKRIEQLKIEYSNWEQLLNDYFVQYPDKKELWDKHWNKVVPTELLDKMLSALPNKEDATRSYSGKVLQVIGQELPFVVGGSADLDPSIKTYIKSSTSIQKDSFVGQNIHFGIREHAMGGIMNGLSLYGSFIPYGGTFLVFSDYMRPSIRLAALMEIPVIYLFSHDSIFIGEDGPTHQPVEHITALRIIPNLVVLRPADGVETAMSWFFALNNQKSPTAILLTRQKVGLINRDTPLEYSTFIKGGYIVKRVDKPDMVLVATGSEVYLAIKVATELMNKNISAQVVSVPSIELLKKQPISYIKEVLPDNVKKVVIEAGLKTCWYEFLDKTDTIIGIETFGHSAPEKDLAKMYGFTVEQIVNKILS